MKKCLPILCFVVMLAAACHGQVAHVATNAPEDKPVMVSGPDMDKLMAPYVKMALKSYPEAKGRFLKGLPPKHSFFITTKISDEKGRSEQIFVVVGDIKDGKITGRVSSDIYNVSGYKRGDKIECSEKDIMDWLITSPDEPEEGNLVGRFIDAYQAVNIPLIIKIETDKAGKIVKADFKSALSPNNLQDVSFCIPDKIKKEAAKSVLHANVSDDDILTFKMPGTTGAVVIYDMHKDVLMATDTKSTEAKDTQPSDD